MPYCRGDPEYDRHSAILEKTFITMLIVGCVISYGLWELGRPIREAGQVGGAKDYTKLFDFFKNKPDIVDDLLNNIDKKLVNELMNTLNKKIPVDSCNTFDNNIIDEMIQYMNNNFKNQILENKDLITKVNEIIDGNPELKKTLDIMYNPTRGGKKNKRIKHKSKRSKKRGGKKTRRKTNKNNK